MKFAIIGAGGVGGYLGTRLATVLKGTLSIKSHAGAPGEVVRKSDFCKIRLGGATGPECRRRSMRWHAKRLEFV